MVVLRLDRTAGELTSRLMVSAVGIPLTGFRAFSVVSTDIGNNPRLYHPYYSKHVGPSFTYSWAYFIHGRIFEWYQK